MACRRCGHDSVGRTVLRTATSRLARSLQLSAQSLARPSSRVYRGGLRFWRACAAAGAPGIAARAAAAAINSVSGPPHRVSRPRGRYLGATRLSADARHSRAASSDAVTAGLRRPPLAETGRRHDRAENHESGWRRRTEPCACSTCRTVFRFRGRQLGGESASARTSPNGVGCASRSPKREHQRLMLDARNSACGTGTCRAGRRPSAHLVPDAGLPRTSWRLAYRPGNALVHPDGWSISGIAGTASARNKADRTKLQLRHKWTLGLGARLPAAVLDRGRGAGKRFAWSASTTRTSSQTQRLMEESLLQLATSDPLTGLWNRRRFVEVVRRELGTIDRNQARQRRCC